MEKQKKVPELRFPEFSGEWECKKLGGVVEIKGGKRIPKGFSLQNENNGFPYITVSDMENGNISLDKIKFVPKEVVDQIRNYKITIDDIYISVAGTIGEVGIIPKELNNANLTENANKLTNLKCNQLYLFQYLKSDKLEKLIENVKTVGAQPKLAIYALNDFEISIPNISEQQKIASFLTAIDDKLQVLKKKKGLLEQYKKGVMQKIFSQELRFKDEDGGEFPEWEEKNGNFIFENISNKEHNSDLPILAITQEFGAIPRELIDFYISVTDKSVESYKVVEVGDFIISLRSFQGGIEYSKYKGICSPAYIILRPFIDINREFYKFYFKTENYIKLLQKNLEGIRDGKMISYKYFSEIELPYPCYEEQTKIANFLSAIDEKINQCGVQIEKMEGWKKGLLQRMFV